MTTCWKLLSSAIPDFPNSSTLPRTSPPPPQPDSNTRYVIRYAIRRLLRVAKYAVIGAGIAFIGTGLLGTLGTGLAWFAVPSTGMGIGMGITWGLIKVSQYC